MRKKDIISVVFDKYGGYLIGICTFATIVACFVVIIRNPNNPPQEKLRQIEVVTTDDDTIVISISNSGDKTKFEKK
jgi:hypothetical protein